MVEPEEALGRLPDDPALAPEPFPAVAARAARRRRRRLVGGGVAAVVGLVAVAMAVSTLLPNQAQVVDTASSGQVAGTAPPLRVASKLAAEGDLEGDHWRLFARPEAEGMCLDLDYRGRRSETCGLRTGAEQAIAGGITTGLDADFVVGVLRGDVVAVRIEAGGGHVEVLPVGGEAGFDVRFLAGPIDPATTPARLLAVDPLGRMLGAVELGPPTGPTVTTSTVVVRPTTTAPPPADDGGGNQSSPVQTSPPQSVVPTPPGSSELHACPPDQVTVSVTTGKAAYAAGEKVTGTSSLRNDSATACLVPARARYAVQDQAGRDVSGFAYTADYALPVRAEPGQSFPGSFTWDQTDCATGPTCTQVPPGTYVAVARWEEGGSFSAQASFRIE